MAKGFFSASKAMAGLIAGLAFSVCAAASVAPGAEGNGFSKLHNDAVKAAAANRAGAGKKSAPTYE